MISWMKKKKKEEGTTEKMRGRTKETLKREGITKTKGMGRAPY